jgi:hypothetical protein
MNKALKLILVALLPMVLLFVTSCKSTRSALKQPLKEYDFNWLYGKMLENHFNFEYVNAKFSISYQEGKDKTDLRGQLRMKYDSTMWVSFSPALGIEAARILLTNDSVKFINRLNKKYFEGEYSLLDSLLNTTIEFSILQSMLIGNDLTQYDVNKYRASIDGGLYRITIQERKKIKQFLKSDETDTKVLVQNIWLDPDNFRVRRVDLKELNSGDDKKLEVVYNEYVQVGDQQFPDKITITISSQKSIVIDVKFIKVEVDEKVDFPFKIPGKYENLL